VLIVKAGGGEALNWEGVCRDIAELRAKEPVILIHGASTRRDALAARLGVPVRMIESPSGVPSVFTDPEAMEVFLMAYAGLSNKRIVERLHRHGVNAVGLTGVDGGLWRARRKDEVLAKQGGRLRLLRGNLSGRVETVNTELLELLLNAGYLPVICAPALSHDHHIVNTDNDAAAAVMAEALGCRRMVWLFEAPGLLRDPDDPSSRIPVIPRGRLQEHTSFARGRMIRKVMGAASALEHGVEEIFWGDGRAESPVLEALAGKGTVIR
jgi:acetylglutamate/LysW-gamma-L-alpha-aminoadipate kinase